ncbi:hypothetical protein [Rhodococcus erythropolis]|uniref:hypothetical protein n=1 Tax=Rhodococcus erythropolis TaxID=1833 RepID=UPI001BE8D4A8|nr:hypothetical protein [Rhodococcus erythropolis]MBT2269601.1 hypothetical protein [Rhodococcus erythropolis]
MTKNAGRKKAARKYQQEHPGTTFPEAMRAVAHPTVKPISMPHGYILLDEEWAPSMFDPAADTAAINASLLAAGAFDALFPQADGAQLTPEQMEEMELRRATSAVHAEGLHDSEHHWGKSTLNPDVRSLLFRDIHDNGPVRLPFGAMVPENMKGSPAVAAAALEPTPREYRTDESDLKERALQSESSSALESRESEPQNAGDAAAARKLRHIFRGAADIEVGLRRLGGIEVDETDRELITGWDGFGRGEFAEQQRSAWRAFEESRRGQHQPFLLRNNLLHSMTTQTVQDDLAT